MKKFALLSIMLISLFLFGCGDEIYLAPGTVEQKQQTHQKTQEQIKKDSSIEVFSKQEKCYNHVKEAKSQHKDNTYVNVYYSPVLDTCILDLFDVWDGEGFGNLVGSTDRTLIDFYTNKQLFHCTMYAHGTNRNDDFVYDEKYFDEDTLSLFEAYGHGQGECNYLFDWASDYLQSTN